MKIIKVIFVALIILILIPGCNLLRSVRIPRQPETTEPEKIEYRVGKKALEMSFLKNFPPDKIRPEQEFQVIVEVKNHGASEINNLDLYLTGLTEQITEVDESKKTIENLPGKSLNFPEGSKEIVNWKVSNKKRLDIDKHTELIRIGACYEYETKASADICINPTSQIFAQKTQEVCKRDQTISLSGGQGAPIAITKIEQTTVPMGIVEGIFQLELKFHISNLGKGVVFKSDNCKDGGIVKIEDISFHKYKIGPGLDCGFREENILAIKQTDNILTCKAQIDSSMGTFSTPLTITLKYWYEDAIDKTIEIIKTE